MGESPRIGISGVTDELIYVRSSPHIRGVLLFRVGPIKDHREEKDVTNAVITLFKTIRKKINRKAMTKHNRQMTKDAEPI